MEGAIFIEFRSALIEVRYHRAGDNLTWEFAEDGLNDVILSARERQDIHREAWGHSEQ